ncbi:MAG: SH3 domain-containing protein [Erysipelotrichaceae bacterium]|nr:SH3 domain-containing protein [Erysipelotrichaceae bacterium]
MKTNNFRLVKILGSLIMCMIIGISMMVSTTNQAEAAKVKAVKAVQIAKKIAKNNKNGYSQSNRTRKNRLGGHEYDCSSFVYTAYKKAGVGVGMGCSSTIKRDFKKKGFKFISRGAAKMGSSKKLQAGDVLVASGHVELYAGGGKMVGAHRNYDGRPGDSTGKEISVSKYYSSGWYGVLRYTRGSSKTTTTAKSTTTTTKISTEEIEIAIDGNNEENNNAADKTDDTTSTETETEVTDGETTPEETKEEETDTPAVVDDKTEESDPEPAAAETEEKTETKKETTSKTSSKSSSKYSKGTWRANLQMNVRRGPGLKYKSIGVISKGQTFKVTKVSGRFGKIKYKGRTAWVSLKYSTKVK